MMLHSRSHSKCFTNNNKSSNKLQIRSRRSVARDSHVAVVPTASYSYRQGRQQDAEFFKKRLLLESMNPLGIKPERFTVVEDTNGAGIVGFAQLAPLPGQNNLEFRSLIVLPEHRGKDIGSQLMQHVVQGASADADIYLTTLRKTIPFYQPAGFKLLQAAEVPWFLWFEAAAGTVVAKVAANDQLVVMHRPARSSTQ